MLFRPHPPRGPIRTLVCLPTYNERENLEPMLRRLCEVLGERDRVLVLDDRSPDGTGELAERLAEELRVVDVLHRPAREGLGRAYLAGFAEALALGAEYVVELDSDFSHDPADIPRLVAAASHADLAIGSRYVGGGSAAGLTRSRKLLSRGGCLYARYALGLRVRDLTSGFKCFRRRVLDGIALESVSSSGYVFQVETTYRAMRAGFGVVEVPIAFGERTNGTTKMGFGIAAEAFWRVPALRLRAALAAARESGRLLAYRRIGMWWAGSRALVFAAALTVQGLGWPRGSWYPSLLHEPGALLRAWDGRWYVMVARRGYLLVPHRQSDPAFFPLLPVLMKGLHALGIPLVAAGLLLANIGFLVGLFALYELARHWLPDADAQRTAIYAAVFPFGFVFSMVYPEGLVLAAMALAGLFAVRGRYVACAVAAALATLGRPEGVFLALPIAAAAVAAWPRLSESQRIRAIWAAAAAPAALAGLAVYEKLALGDAIAFSHAQREWGRWFSAAGFHRAFAELANASVLHREWLYRDAGFLVLYLACLALALRAGVPRIWVLSGALLVLLPLETGSVTSISRFGLLALPVYAGLAWLGRRAWLDHAVRVVGSCLLTAGTATILLHWP